MLITGCAQTPTIAPTAPATPAPAQPEPLQPGALADLLTAEIAFNRGDSAIAYERLARQVEQTQDPDLALRAARIATQLEPTVALAAAQQLARLSQSYEARALLARAWLILGQVDEAVIELRAAAELSPSQVLGFLPRLLQGQPQWAGELADQLNPSDQLALEIPWLYATEVAYGAESALGIALNLTRKYPQRASLYSEAARLAQQAQGIAAAIEILDAGIEQHPQDQSLLLTRTQLQVADERYNQAILGFESLAELDPNEPSYRVSQGMLAIEIKDFDTAQQVGQQLSADPSSESDGRLILGLVASAQGELARAESLLKTQQGERFLLARTQLAQAYLEAGDLKAAERWFAQGRAIRPDQSVTLYLTQAQLLSESEQDADLVSLMTQALDDHPGEFQLLYARALYRERDDFAAIIADLQAALEVEPDNASALNALGYTYADANLELELALDLIGRALAIRTDDAAILDSMGWVHFRLGNTAQALSWLERAFEQMPDAEIGAHLGEVLWSDGQLERAKATWQQAQELDADNAILQETLQRLGVEWP